MAATEHTQNLNLPIYSQTDFTDWSDYNESMEIIDGAVGTQDTNISKVETETQANTNAIASLNESITTLINSQNSQAQSIVAQGTRITNLETNMAGVQNDISALNEDVKNLTDLVGDLPPNLEQTLNSLQEKDNQLTTAVNTAQAEADTATQAATNATTRVAGIKENRTLATIQLSTIKAYVSGTEKQLQPKAGFSQNVYLSARTLTNQSIVGISGNFVFWGMSNGQLDYANQNPSFKIPMDSSSPLTGIATAIGACGIQSPYSAMGMPCNVRAADTNGDMKDFVGWLTKNPDNSLSVYLNQTESGVGFSLNGYCKIEF